jgi:hypothetical protein
MTSNNGRPDATGSSDSEVDEPLDPAAMYALLQNQQRSAQIQMGDFVWLITFSWGVTWLVGFGALWLIDGVDGFALPVPVAVTVFIATLVASGLLSAWLGFRSGRGMRGNGAAAFTGTVYGITWAVGSTAIAILGGGLRAQGMAADLAAYYYPCAYVLFAGIMYVLAGAIWQAVPSLVGGLWLVVVAVAAAFVPYPNHYLFLALAGGLAFLALSAFGALQQRRVRAATNGANRG